MAKKHIVEKRLAIFITSMIVALMAIIVTPAVLLTSQNTDFSPTAVVTYDSYLVHNDEYNNLGKQKVYEYRKDDASTEIHAHDIAVVLESRSHLLFSFKIENFSTDSNLIGRFSFGVIRKRNCVLSYSQDDGEYIEGEIEDFKFSVNPEETTNINIKVEILDLAIGAVFDGSLLLNVSSV